MGACRADALFPPSLFTANLLLSLSASPPRPHHYLVLASFPASAQTISEPLLLVQYTSDVWASGLTVGYLNFDSLAQFVPLPHVFSFLHMLSTHVTLCNSPRPLVLLPSLLRHHSLMLMSVTCPEAG